MIWLTLSDDSLTELLCTQTFTAVTEDHRAVRRTLDLPRILLPSNQEGLQDHLLCSKGEKISILHVAKIDITYKIFIFIKPLCCNISYVKDNNCNAYFVCFCLILHL